MAINIDNYLDFKDANLARQIYALTHYATLKQFNENDTNFENFKDILNSFETFFKSMPEEILINLKKELDDFESIKYLTNFKADAYKKINNKNNKILINNLINKLKELAEKIIEKSLEYKDIIFKEDDELISNFIKYKINEMKNYMKEKKYINILYIVFEIQRKGNRLNHDIYTHELIENLVKRDNLAIISTIGKMDIIANEYAYKFKFLNI